MRRGKKPIIFFLRNDCSFIKIPGVPFPKVCFVPNLVDIAQWFWIFLNLNNVFRYYTPLEKPWSFICRNPMLLHPKKMCAKFG